MVIPTQTLVQPVTSSSGGASGQTHVTAEGTGTRRATGLLLVESTLRGGGQLLRCGSREREPLPKVLWKSLLFIMHMTTLLLCSAFVAFWKSKILLVLCIVLGFATGQYCLLGFPKKVLLIQKISGEGLKIAVFVDATEIQGCLNKPCACSQYLAKGLQLNTHTGGENTFVLIQWLT